jgi:hypothetical protein
LEMLRDRKARERPLVYFLCSCVNRDAVISGEKETLTEAKVRHSEHTCPALKDPSRCALSEMLWRRIGDYGVDSCRAGLG